MRFTVTWTPLAKQALTQLWLSARDQHSVREAADRIDELLATAPMSVGESRVDPVRVLVVEPLSVFYSVRFQDNSPNMG